MTYILVRVCVERMAESHIEYGLNVSPGNGRCSLMQGLPDFPLVQMSILLLVPSRFFETRAVGAFRRLQVRPFKMSNFYLRGRTDRRTDGEQTDEFRESDDV